MPLPNDLRKSLVALHQDSTLIVVVELSHSHWLVAGMVPGVQRHPLKKLPADETALWALLQRWQQQAARAGRSIKRTVVAFEAGRDGFWLARWLLSRNIEAYVIHATSVAVPREHRRAKTDRLDTEHLKRALLGWLRGEPGHCNMAAIPSIEEEDSKRPQRQRETLVRERTRILNRIKACLARFGIRGFKSTRRKMVERVKALVTPEGVPLPPNTLLEITGDIARLNFVADQMKQLERRRLAYLKENPTEPNPMVILIARVIGVGIDTADLLVNEVLARKLRDRRALARYGGLTGSPDESGKRRREKGLARAGNLRVRRAMIQLAWRFLRFQTDSALADWYRKRTADARGATRKVMIVALARKLLIALSTMVTTGEIPPGVRLHAAVA